MIKDLCGHIGGTSRKLGVLLNERVDWKSDIDVSQGVETFLLVAETKIERSAEKRLSFSLFPLFFCLS